MVGENQQQNSFVQSQPGFGDVVVDKDNVGVVYGHGIINGIVSVHVSAKRATIYTRHNGQVQKIEQPFTQWALIGNRRLQPYLKGCNITDLKGALAFKWKAEITDRESFEQSAVYGWNQIHPKESVETYREVRDIYMRNLVEQFLIATGNTYYKGLRPDDVVRVQLDIETTGLDPNTSKVFMVSIKSSRGIERVIDGEDEKSLLRQLTAIIQELDPDVIENHNIFGFDLPFLTKRYEFHGIAMKWGRDESVPFVHGDAIKVGESTERFTRYTIRGREVVDTLHSVKRRDAITRDMESHALKYAAKHLGVARSEDAYIEGDKIYETYKCDPEQVRKYALADVREVDAISRLLNADKFILAQMVPMKFEKVCTTGSVNLIELPILREYLRQGHSVPKPAPAEAFEGAFIEILATGVFENVTKIDVASLYPSIILLKKIEPTSDPLGVFLRLASVWKDLRIYHKARKKDPTSDAIQSAMKVLINSMFGFLGSNLGLFNNPKGAAEITKAGREITKFILGVIKSHGGRPIEVDTDGIITEIPAKTTPGQFANSVNKVIEPEYPGIVVEDEGLWSKAYVKGKKNYAYIRDGKIKIVGGALKNRSYEKIFRDMISIGLENLLASDVDALRATLRDVYNRISTGACSAEDIQTRKKLGKSVVEYQAEKKQTLPHFEVMIAAGKLDAPQGSVASYYKVPTGYAHIDKFAGDYDRLYYLKAFRSKAAAFSGAFSLLDFDRLTDFDSEPQPLTTTATEVDPVNHRLWINLSSDLKHSPKNNGRREKLVELDDNDEIKKFISRKKNIDVYRTALAYLAPEKPKRANGPTLMRYKMLGDFWIELEGSYDDDAIMTSAVAALTAVVDVLEHQFGVPRLAVRRYYNGGKSLYVRVPFGYFVGGPEYRLDAKYELLFKHIKSLLPVNLAERLDSSLYDITQVLRIPGSQYPGRNFMVEVPVNFEFGPDWKRLMGFLEVAEDVDPFFLPTPPPHETTLSRERFNVVTKAARFKTHRASQGTQKEKNRIIDRFLAANPEKCPPCLKGIAAAIAKGEPIGFGGKSKLVHETTRMGLSEQEIVKIFLMDPDDHHYGVLDSDPTTETGFRLKSGFRTSMFADVGCDHSDLCRFCQYQQCYRSELGLKVASFGEGDPSFEEFQKEAQKKLKEFINDQRNERPTCGGENTRDGGEGSSEPSRG